MYAIYGGILFLGRNVISTMQYGKPPLESSAPRAVKMKMKIVETPVHVINHGESKVRIIRDTVKMLRDLRKMKKRIKKAEI